MTEHTEDNIENNDVDDATSQIAKLTAKNFELIGKIKEMNNKTKAFEGFDLDEYQALKAAKAAADEKKEKEKGNYEALLKKHQDAAAAQYNELKLKADTLQSKFVNAQYSAKIETVISSQNGISKLLRPVLDARAKAVLNDDGEIEYEVLDENGNHMPGVTLDELVAELKADPDFGSAFRSSAATGGGATGASKVGTGVYNPWAKETFNMTKQGELERTDPVLAAKLKAAVGK